MVDRVTLGQIVTIDGAFRVWNPATQTYDLADPTTLKLVLGRPDGSRVTVTYGSPPYPELIIAFSSTGAGLFFAEVRPDVSGRWTWRWEASGNVDGAGEGEFTVSSLQDQPLTFLREGEDYDNVRALLGVTELDVDDEIIERPVFGLQADLRVKSWFPDWEAMIADPETEQKLRLVACYVTAALIAESMAKGGFLGLMRPDGQDRNWAAEAQALMATAVEWVNTSQPEGAVYDLPMVALATPGSARRRVTAAVPPQWADSIGVRWGGWRER